MDSEVRSGTTGSLSRGERGAGDLRPIDASARRTELADRPPTSTGLTERKPSPDFATAMGHFYRGETGRSNTWRSRLDTTTTWAVVTTGATVSFSFSSVNNPHFVILMNSVLVTFFLSMEARRYRYYEVWSSRARVVETSYFAPLLRPGVPVDKGWESHLAGDLSTPSFTISGWEAFGRRLRRSYLWIFILLALSWNLKIYLHPHLALSFNEFIARAGVGIIPGQVIFSVGIIFNIGIFVIALATIGLREARGTRVR